MTSCATTQRAWTRLRVLSTSLVLTMVQISLPAAGSAGEDIGQPEGQSTKQDATAFKIVTFGTSLTARGGWQHALEAALTQCLQQPMNIVTVAKSGATSAWGLDHVPEVTKAEPDVIVLEFYANDATIHRFTSLAESRKTIKEILARLRRDNPNAKLILQIMNPILGVRRWIRPFLDAYIDAHIQAAREAGVAVVDHRPAWDALDYTQLAAALPDGAHPKPAVAAKIIVPRLAREIGGAACNQPPLP